MGFWWHYAVFFKKGNSFKTFLSLYWYLLHYLFISSLFINSCRIYYEFLYKLVIRCDLQLKSYLDRCSGFFFLTLWLIHAPIALKVSHKNRQKQFLLKQQNKTQSTDHFHLYWPVHEPLDIITSWPSSDNNIHQTFSVCESKLHNSQEIYTIPFDKTLSVQPCSRGIWCESFSSLKASQSGQGQSEPLQKVHFLLLKSFCCWIYSCALDCFYVVSPKLLTLQWLSILLQSVLISFRSLITHAFQVQKQHNMMACPPYFTAEMWFWCWCTVILPFSHCPPTKQHNFGLICSNTILPAAFRCSFLFFRHETSLKLSLQNTHSEEE